MELKSWVETKDVNVSHTAIPIPLAQGCFSEWRTYEK